LAASFVSIAHQVRRVDPPEVVRCVFIAHSPNKPHGTANIAEHPTSRFVVGVGNETREEMFND
jgi:hypothetical protein